MPTVNEVLGGLLENAIQNPKTTASSTLTVLIGVIPALLSAHLIHGKAAAISLSLVSAAKFILGTFFQKDAGKTPAFPPGASEPVMVPSHEVPNDPAAVPAAPKVTP